MMLYLLTFLAMANPRRRPRQKVGAMPVRWVKAPADSKWTRASAALRARPGEWAVLDVTSANLSTDARRIELGVLAAFKPPGHFRATVRDREIWAVYSPPGTLTGDDPPS